LFLSFDKWMHMNLGAEVEVQPVRKSVILR
jgi:hypothetical protein